MKVRYMVVVSLMVLALIVVGCVKPAPPAPEVTPEVEEFVMPEVIYMSSLGVESGNYAQAAIIADAMMKKYGVRMRVIPGGTSPERLNLLRGGDVHVWGEGSGQWAPFEGLDDYGLPAWGPQSLRMIWRGPYPQGCSLMTACDANIKTPADLKGKKVGWLVGDPGRQLLMAAYLAFANLTWDDVIKVEFPSHSAWQQGLVTGKHDALVNPPSSPSSYELEASPRGCCWPTIDPDDKEAWTRMTAVCGYIFPFKASGGAGMEPGKTYDITTFPGMGFTVYASASEDFVYNLAKMINESYDLYKDQELVNTFNAEQAMKTPVGYHPYHEGTVKYLKEIGYWTAEHEAWQNEMLERDRILQATWKAAREEAIEKEMSIEDSRDFWLEKRAEALKKAGLPVYGF